MAGTMIFAPSIEECFNNYTYATWKIHRFGKYKDISAKDNERMLSRPMQLWKANPINENLPVG